MRLLEFFKPNIETRDIDASMFNLGLEDKTKTSSGKTVDPSSAIQSSSVYSCVSLISDSIATMPVKTYRKTQEYREPTTPPIFLDNVNGMPNAETDLFTWMHRTINSLCLYGNSYWLITSRDRNGFPSSLYNLHPDDMQITRKNGKAIYTYNGKENFTRYTVLNPSGEIVHIKNFEQGSDYGLSPIEAGSEAIGSALAQDEFAGTFFKNGAVLSGVIEMNSTPTEEQLRIFKQSFNRKHQGSNKAHNIGILTEGSTWKPLALDHEQMQFLQSRKYTKSEICGLFRVPAYMIGDLSETTKLGSSIEEQNRVFYELTLLPYINRVETALTMLLPRNQFARIDVSGLLRANIKARYEAYNLGRNAGFLSVNEIRAKEDLSPVDSEIGDSYLQNLNQVAVEDTEDQSE
ncbi:phage portal protein [Acidimicrobiia bacterium]|nr:phage portal protein [Acidimicrobiia bacterium]